MLRRSLSICLLSALTLVAVGCSSSSANGGGTTTTGAAVITFSAPTLSFATTPVGQTGSAIVATATNTGTGTATLTGFTQSGNTADFNLASTCTPTTSLAAGASCNFTVTFAPVAAGPLSLTLSVSDNATNSPQSVTFTGTGGAAATAALSPGSLTFPTTNVGSPSTAQFLTLSNTGTASLAISSIVLSGTNLDQFTETNNCGAAVAATASCTITVVFAPTQVGTFSATVVVTDNTGNVTGSTQSATLSGTSVGPIASFSPSSITFPGTTLNVASAAQNVTVTNNGTAALNFTTFAITGGTTSSAFKVSANTCGTTIAAAATCTLSITFTPGTTGTNTGSLSVTDNAPGSPQTVALSGTGQAAPAPIATLSATSVTFPNTLPAGTSAPTTITLTNTGSLTLNLASIVLGGTNPGNFAESNTCGASLLAGASCTITATFSPATLVSYMATVTLTDNSNNVTGATQTISLNGTGSTNTTYHTLVVIPESDNSITPLYALINNAQKSIDMTMYALEDTTFTAYLVADCKRGVVVRVILDQNNEKSGNTSAFNALNAQANCSAVWANKAFAVTHEKSIMIDGTIDIVMSLNLQSQYYSTTRDYAIIDNDAADYAADEATFSMDYVAGTTSAGVIGVSDYTYVPGTGTDLTWSPYPEGTSQTAMLAIINNATKTLYIECEEFSAGNIVSAVAAAAGRGVTVVLVGENESNSYTSDYATIKAAGANVYYYSSSTGFYVHAKAVVADLGLTTEAVYVGSINYSTASLDSNRELGIYITGNTAVSNPIAAMLAATTIADESQAGVTHY